MSTPSPLAVPKLSAVAAILAVVAVFDWPPVALAEAGTTATLVVPIVLSSGGAGGSFYTTELTLTNRGATAATAELKYTAAFGGGDGTCTETLLPGEQKVIPDAIVYLRGKNLPLPPEGDRGGSLLVRFVGLSSPDAAAVTARTTTATGAPQPVGAAGLAYVGTPMDTALKGSATLYGIRATSQDRSNAAVYNPTTGDLTVRVTVFAGDGSGASLVKAEALKIPSLGWVQVNGILDDTGFASGWVTVERTGGYGAFGAYGVVNCNGTSDGSFIPHVAGSISGERITVPVLVETTSGFVSELVLANRSASEATLTLGYVESLTPSLGSGGTVAVKLRAGEQLILPDALEYLRGKGLNVGAKGAASYAGALRVLVAGAPLAEVFAGARTASLSPAGGQFGLFTPGVYEGEEATNEAFLYGLKADSQNRTNVAVVNTGAEGAESISLSLQAYDGDAGGVARGEPEVIQLGPGAWMQSSGFLGSRGVEKGWVRVTRLSGSAPWLAYGVVNDGGGPGQRTGDGAYVPMVVTLPPSRWEISVLTDPGRSIGSPALAFSRDGSPTIAYVRVTEEFSSHVKVARWDPIASSWQIVSLQPEGGDDAWHTPAAATDPKDGNPSVVYGSEAINFAHWSGASWRVETVETVGQVNDHPSLAYGPDGNPSISYLAKTPTPGIRFARWNGSSWIVQSVDPDTTAGSLSSLAYDREGNPAVAYGTRSVNASRTDTLKLARWSGSRWETEIVETGVAYYGWRPSLVFDAQGFPAIAHARGLSGPPGIRFVRWDGSRWSAELVSPGGTEPGLVLDSSGAPLVGFAEWTPGVAWFARRDSRGAWKTEIVEGSLHSADSPCTTLDPAGRPAMAYTREQETPGGGTARSIGLARVKPE